MHEVSSWVGEPKSSLQRDKSRKCQKVVTFSFAFVTEREATWKFWSPEGTKLIGSGQGKIPECSVIKDTWRIA